MCVVQESASALCSQNSSRVTLENIGTSHQILLANTLTPPILPRTISATCKGSTFFAKAQILEIPVSPTLNI
jgi:hypothetical protein